MKVYGTLVLSVLLYNSETWTLKDEQIWRLQVFEMSCLRKLEEDTRRDGIRTEEIFNKLHVSRNIVNHQQQRRLQDFKHVSRTEKSRYPKTAVED